MTKGPRPLGVATLRIMWKTSPPRKRSRRTGKSASIRALFHSLETALGPQHWWPADSAFEVVVGAYLTQNTAWSNVERAIANLRAAGCASVEGIRSISAAELEALLRPAGYFRQKAARLKGFVAHLDARYGGSLEAMLARPPEALRAELLSLNGIGPETADSILLYAASREVFVVDAYTRRIFQRHRLAGSKDGYEEIRAAVEAALAGDGVASTPKAAAVRAAAKTAATARRNPVRRPGGNSAPEPSPKAHPPSPASGMARSEIARRFNEFHALLVQTGKHYCRKAAPRCECCPLAPLLPPGAKPH
jgi:endonuclease-3 related protein